VNVVDALERVGQSEAMNYTGKREARGRERTVDWGTVEVTENILRLIDEVGSAEVNSRFKLAIGTQRVRMLS